MNFNQMIGASLIVLGVVVGVYAGGYLCLLGGLLDIIEQIKAVETSVLAVGLGLFKMFISGLVGWLSALILIIPGSVLFKH